MTCECGAQMCYLCRKPVHNGYNHFYGQGGVPNAGRNCPLFTNNTQVHENDVARGAREAKAKMDDENPNVILKYDPTSDIPTSNEMPQIPDQPADGLVDGLLPADPRERERFIQQQQQLLDNIRRNNRADRNILPHPDADDYRGRPQIVPPHHVGGNPGNLVDPVGGNINQHMEYQHGNVGGNMNVPDVWDVGHAQAQPFGLQHRQDRNAAGQIFNPYFPFARPPNEAHVQQQVPYPPIPPQPHPGLEFGNHLPAGGDYNVFVDRMGELLQLREAQRQRQRAIRRREQQALEAFQVHRLAANNEINPIPLQLPVTAANQKQHHNKHQILPIQPNVISNSATPHNIQRTDARSNGSLPSTSNQPRIVNQNHQNDQYNNTTHNQNPLLVPPRLHMQDHHYAYHQRIQRHLNPVPNPIQPPPNAGSQKGKGAPPPAHPAIPHTVALPPLPPVTSGMLLRHHHNVPPPAHPQRVQHQNIKTTTGNVPHMAEASGTRPLQRLQSQKPKPGRNLVQLETLGTSKYAQSSSGTKSTLATKPNVKHDGVLGTNITTLASQTLGQSKNTTS